MEIDQKTGGLISELIDNHDFEAKPSQVSVVYTRGLLPAKRIALLGLGKHDNGLVGVTLGDGGFQGHAPPGERGVGVSRDPAACRCLWRANIDIHAKFLGTT